MTPFFRAVWRHAYVMLAFDLSREVDTMKENPNLKFCKDCEQPALFYTGCGATPPRRLKVPTTDNWHKFIATKYCPSCAESWRKSRDCWRHQAFRRRRREMNNNLRKTVNQQSRQMKQAENALYNADRLLFDMEEKIKKLERTIAILEDEKIAEYKKGKADERRGMLASWLGFTKD